MPEHVVTAATKDLIKLKKTLWNCCFCVQYGKLWTAYSSRGGITKLGFVCLLCRYIQCSV